MNIILFDDIPKFLSYSDERARHIRKVLGLRTGDTFRAGILNGPVGTIEILGSDNEGYKIEWTETGPPVDLYPITMITGFVRPISAKRILREAASLGVGRLVFTVTDTGERSYLKANLWKTGEFREYLKNGLQTAGATVLPQVDLCAGVREAVGKALEGSGEPVLLVMDNRAGRRRISDLNLKGRQVIYGIGPERGWSDRERELFFQAGFEPVLMGSRILRTETACSAATGLLLQGMDLV